MTSAAYSIEINRDSGGFDIWINYTIPAYNDPETGETFSDTSWTVTFTPGYGTGGWGGESETVPINVGFSADDLVHRSLMTFYAQNMFSADNFTDTVNIVSAGLSQIAQTLDGTAGFDIIVGGYADDLLQGFGDNDHLDAGNGSDTLQGGDGADTLIGGAGRDRIEGGANDDIYYVDDPYDVVFELAGSGADAVYSTVNYTLGSQIETLVLVGGELNGSGNNDGNDISGTALRNVLRGNGGRDFLRGEGGDDWLLGGSDDDDLDGGTGNDKVEGGTGNDTYRLDTQSDRIIERDSEGNADAVVTFGLAAYTLRANLENLSTASFGNFTGVGNAGLNLIAGNIGNDRLFGRDGNDTLNGDKGDDLLDGGTGADSLIGGEGMDAADYSGAVGGVSVNLATGGAAGVAWGDRYSGIEGVKGTRFGDRIIGDAFANYLEGRAGVDTIAGDDGDDIVVGGRGADNLDGGDGRDTLSYAGSTDAVRINLDTRTAAGGDASGDLFICFENVAGGAGDDELMGNDLANGLYGAGGDDTIVGGGGSDVIEGGIGADFLVGHADGRATLSYAHSTDTVTVDLATSTALGGDAAGDIIALFGHATGGAGNDALSGNAGNNFLSGAAGDDSVSGGQGDDTLQGGAGADTLAGGDGNDTVSYAGAASWIVVYLEYQTAYGDDAVGDVLSGVENVIGGNAGDALYGGTGANVLRGEDGNDVLGGYGGNDTVTGGAGNDTFYLTRGYNQDTITDFTVGEDLITIYGLDADFDTFQEIMDAATSYGAGGQHTQIDFGEGDVLLLRNVTLASLTIDSFEIII